MGKRTRDGASVARRRRLVAELAAKRLSGREIAKALAALPEGERPESCSVPTVARDLAALKEEWAAERRANVAELLDEELARLNALEQSWWPKAVDPAGPEQGRATNRVLAIMRQRMKLLGVGGGAGRRTAARNGGAALTRTSEASGASGPAKIRAELVDDWRDA